MPIFHLYMPEAGLVVPNEAATDLGELTERMIMAGAQLRTFAARDTALLTPAYWGDERKNDYLLMMKANPNAARLHILPRAIGGVSMQTFIDTDGTLRIAPLRTINIPADTDSFAIGRAAGRQTEVAGVVMHLAAREALDLEKNEPLR